MWNFIRDICSIFRYGHLVAEINSKSLKVVYRQRYNLTYCKGDFQFALQINYVHVSCTVSGQKLHIFPTLPYLVTPFGVIESKFRHNGLIFKAE